MAYNDGLWPGCIMTHLNSLPLTLRPSKLKLILSTIASILFTIGGVWMASEQPFWGYAAAIFFGLAIIVFGIQLLPNSSYLKLTEEGFEVCSTFRTNSYRWSDIESFSIMNVPLNKMVSWDFSSNYDAQQTGRRVSSRVTGSEAALPDTYGMSAAELADLMNGLLKRHRQM